MIEATIFSVLALVIGYFVLWGIGGLLLWLLLVKFIDFKEDE